MTRKLPAVVAICSFLFGGVDTASADPPPKFDPPRKYYLALGDSLAFGFQSQIFNENYSAVSPDLFTQGYVDVFAGMLEQLRPDIQTLNFGCVGETTNTFIEGGCLYTTQGFELHDTYSGSQLAAAVAFIDAHPGKVSPITFNLGTNDLNGLVETCGSDFACYQQRGPDALSAIEENLDYILDTLRRAAPNTEIITFTSYSVAFLSDPRFLELTNAFNASVERTAKNHRVHVAQVFDAFNEQPQPATICDLTLICSAQDSHPSDTGYRVIAEQLWDTSGYSQKR
jgi:lysophospholipase L1-like esterase